MPCDRARELISAALDDEVTPAERSVAEAHLASCPDCAAWQAMAAHIRRRTRLQPERTDPAFVAQVMATARPARLGRGGWMRPVLAWCAAVIGVQSFGPLVFGEVDGASAHLSRHLGASGMALALALLYVAWRPHRAFGLLPFVAALLAATVLSSAVDLIAGHRSAFAEATHIAELAGTVVLWMMAGSPGVERVLSRSLRPGGGRGDLRATR